MSDVLVEKVKRTTLKYESYNNVKYAEETATGTSHTHWEIVVLAAS